MRLFVAIDISPPVRAELASLMKQLQRTEPRARWVRVEGMHVTLKFLGETRPEHLPAIHQALEKITSRSAVEMRFRGLGFFPNARRPRVLWAGIEASPNLAELAQGVDQAVEPSGFPRETRSFVPHLTLARFPAPGGWDALVRATGELSSHEFGSSSESDFHLIQSFLKPSGAEYKKLASFAFVKEPA